MLNDFHVMLKPTGAACNLGCSYCFYQPKESLYPDGAFRMDEALLENYIQQLLRSQESREVATVAWQGGEPTLMGLDFFRKSIEYVRKHQRPGMKVLHTMQTNGVLLDRDWCEFFREHKFLIGLSVDGPRELHDAYRVDKGGHPTFDKIIRAANLMQRHGVEFNILTAVHAANADHPLQVYRFLRDKLGAQFIQFIPVVERINDDGRTLLQQGNRVTTRSVRPEQWGRFLTGVFDEWVRRDVGRIFVQIFDSALASWAGAPQPLCIFGETCGQALAVEHNGDIYSCDHFVEPAHLLGNIRKESLAQLAGSEKQRAFGNAKRDNLPSSCLSCEVRFACNGECPKNRFVDSGESQLNYLCAGYKAFFQHIDRPMEIMAGLLRSERAPAEIMQIFTEEEAARISNIHRTGRNDPCPCGSGRKFKRCHG